MHALFVQLLSYDYVTSLNGNTIGDSGARALVEGLKQFNMKKL